MNELNDKICTDVSLICELFLISQDNIDQDLQMSYVFNVLSSVTLNILRVNFGLEKLEDSLNVLTRYTDSIKKEYISMGANIELSKVLNDLTREQDGM